MVPRLWPGETVACLATGASLTVDQIAIVRRAGWRMLAISDAVYLAPDADLLFSHDGKWWHWHKPAFSGLRVCGQGSVTLPDILVLRPGHSGVVLEDDPGHLAGTSSGHQAINLAYLLGAARIVLLGYDMHGGHFFGDHPAMLATPARFGDWILEMGRMAVALADRGIEVVNCSPGSALECFTCDSLTHLARAPA